MNEERNVIVLLTDSMRVDHLGCYGNEWIKTPNIDKLASEGIIFDHAYSEGLPTLPARTAFFTGRYTFPFRGWQRLDPEDVLLSEIFWSKQINSAIISDCWHLHEPPHNDYGRGFRYVQWIRGQEHDPYILDKNVKITPQNYYSVWEYSDYEKRRKHLFEQYLRNTAHWKSNEDTFAAQVVNAGTMWLERNYSAEPFILWLDCFDPHAPYDPRFPPYDHMYDTGWNGRPILWAEGMVDDYPEKEDLVKQVRANYAGEVSLVDERVGRFLEKVDELGLFENTMIIYLSDHGEPLGDHGFITKVRDWPYEELSHIPTIIRLPGEARKGKRIESFIQTPDIMPTILDFLGIEIPNFVQGKSLLPIIRGERTENERDFAVSGYYNASWSIRNTKWSFYMWLDERRTLKTTKELYEIKGFIHSPEPRKYRLREDVFEKDNIIVQEPEIAEEMETKLKMFVDTLEHS